MCDSIGEVATHTKTAHTTITITNTGTEGSHPKRSGNKFECRLTRIAIPATRFATSSVHGNQAWPSLRIRYISIPTMKNAEYGPINSMDVVSHPKNVAGIPTAGTTTV